MNQADNNPNPDFFFTNKKGEKLGLIDIMEKNVTEVTFNYLVDINVHRMGFGKVWPEIKANNSLERIITIRDNFISLYFFLTSKTVTLRLANEAEYHKIFNHDSSLSKKVILNSPRPYQVIVPVKNLLAVDWL